MADDVKVHIHPVWRDKADFMLNMKIDSEDDALRYEQLWVRRHDAELFEICCIPFFLYDLALGDVVRVSARDGRQVMEGVVETAGHHTFRAWFGSEEPADVKPGIDAGKSNETAKDDVVRQLEKYGFLFEWFSAHLLAIDAATDEMAVMLADYLLAQEEQGYLQYETGRTE